MSNCSNSFFFSPPARFRSYSSRPRKQFLQEITTKQCVVANSFSKGVFRILGESK
ncbi:hypothetical protein J3E72DRAFT_227929 [Bipolaris maydis]|nr:hypothetical protein J3E72DRAFT_227929 [Bipolaris maydis]